MPIDTYMIDLIDIPNKPTGAQRQALWKFLFNKRDKVKELLGQYLHEDEASEVISILARADARMRTAKNSQPYIKE